jgi:hypothetical protein
VEHGTSEPINFVDYDAVKLALSGVGHQPIKGGAAGLGTGEPSVDIFWGSLTAEVAIFTFLHVSGKIRPKPATLSVNDTLLLKLSYSRLAARDTRRMMRILRKFLIRGLWKRNRSHYLYFSSLWHFPPDADQITGNSRR